MSKQIILWIILLLFPAAVFTQENNELNQKDKGEQILSSARKASGIENIKLESFRLKIKSNYSQKIFDSVDEINVSLPDKIRLIKDSSDKSFPIVTTSIWNGINSKKFSESDYFGQRLVVDMTKQLSNSQKEGFSSKIGKEKVNKLNASKRLDDKELFYNDVWCKFFALTLKQPFEQDLEFKYMGKAKSGNTTANVVDVKSENGHTYRLLFDTETSYLLMMIQSYEGENSYSGEKGLIETKYYYSDRQKVNGLLIPKKIKLENKFTPEGKETRIAYSSYDILDFQINPEFKENMFETK